MTGSRRCCKKTSSGTKNGLSTKKIGTKCCAGGEKDGPIQSIRLRPQTKDPIGPVEKDDIDRIIESDDERIEFYKRQIEKAKARLLELEKLE